MRATLRTPAAPAIPTIVSAPLDDGQVQRRWRLRIRRVRSANHGGWIGSRVRSTLRADERAAGANLPVLRVLGQIASMFIIAEGPDGMYLIDQHAAHERILFES